MKFDYTVNHNPVEIVAGTSNTTSPVYLEAAKILGGSENKSMGYLKNFVTSMEQAASKAGSDSRISSSRGTISKFSKYKDLQDGLKLLQDNFGSLPFVKNLQTLHNAVVSNQSQYSDGYDKGIRLMILEYESAVYLLITGVSFAIANYMDVKITGTKMVIAKKSGADSGIIVKTVADMASKLSAKDHKGYLDTLIKAKEAKPLRDDKPAELPKEDDKKDEKEIKESAEYLIEAGVGDTVELVFGLAKGVGKIAGLTKNLFLTVKRTAFGIIPLIRSIMYLKYKKKADTVLSLEQQMQFVRMNIEQLQNIKGMDENKKKDVIKRQEAQIEAYRKKAEKLRAELSETEKEVQTAVAADNTAVKKAPATDDFVLD
jgi:hypothetical protein